MELISQRNKYYDIQDERNYYVFCIIQYAKFVFYCNDIDGLMQELDIQHFPCEWSLPIDSLNHSLKAVLLHNGNQKSSILVAYLVTMNEIYENISSF